jgi:pheromone shutdown-related protein TraB
MELNDKLFISKGDFLWIMENLRIIGSSHIAKDSMAEVERVILEDKPDVVAIELDRKRLLGLLSGQKSKIGLEQIRAWGLKGFLFNLIGGWAEKKMGYLVGVKPGSEMLAAAKAAKKIGAKIALIDRDIEITMKEFSKAFRAKEKWHLLRDVFMGLFFAKRELKRLGIKELDLSKVPPKKLIKKLIERVKEDYPGVYKVLIEDRNRYMADRLMELSGKKIVAVVGAGHEEGIKELLGKKEKITFTYSVG